MKCASCGEKNVGPYHECDKVITPNNDGIRGTNLKTANMDDVHRKMDEQKKSGQRSQRGWGK